MDKIYTQSKYFSQSKPLFFWDKPLHGKQASPRTSPLLVKNRKKSVHPINQRKTTRHTSYSIRRTPCPARIHRTQHSVHF